MTSVTSVVELQPAKLQGGLVFLLWVWFWRVFWFCFWVLFCENTLSKFQKSLPNLVQML